MEAQGKNGSLFTGNPSWGLYNTRCLSMKFSASLVATWMLLDRKVLECLGELIGSINSLLGT